MDAFCERLEHHTSPSNRAMGDRILDAIDAHYDLIRIHPFADGNGRTARLLMNLMLSRLDLPFIIVPPSEKIDYVAGLANRDKEKGRKDFRNYMLVRLRKALDHHIGKLSNEGPARGATTKQTHPKAERPAAIP